MTVILSPTLTDTVTRSFTRRSRLAFAIPAAILVYLFYASISFDLAGLASRARFDNAAVLLGDFWSHKTHVTRDNRTDRLTVAIEGEAKGTYPVGMLPDWVRVDGTTATIDLGQGHIVTYDDQSARYVVPGYGTIDIRPRDGKPVLTAPEPIPGWISVSENKVSVTTDAGRFSYSRSKVETFKYEPGWELWFFTLDSPFYGKSFGELASLAIAKDRIDPARSNLGYMASEFWTNKMWRHGDVAWAIFETILMAFLGTMTAALVALPLGFLAARNFNPLGPLRFAARRVFDFIRGVDGLIWTIILSRAFGPGPMTGAIAIAITDVGTFGKTFSEALEN
ncbi:MAG: phosphonate ABC transporter, permease protein PhnE, partial [Gemmobacter sp.]|nr:phosphonate ABC transporter, permease protein PhnE [Gemmobacter sp.]